MGRARLFVEGLSAFRAVDKLNRGGVEVLFAQKTEKFGVFIDVKSKDLKKGFAILRASCYNVKKVRYLGISRLVRKLLPRAGLLAGGICFLLAVSLAQTRVLRVDVAGSGRCYESEVRDILFRAGLGTFSTYPSDTSAITAQILSLPRVSYCAFSYGGGIVTVEVQVSDEGGMPAFEPLLSPIAGRVCELTVVRGRACVSVGDEIAAGACLVDSVREDGSYVLVMASVSLSFSELLTGKYASEQEALSWARLVFENAERLTVSQTENGWLAEGILQVSINMI